MFICKHCNSERKSQKALIAHECVCSHNANRKIPWNIGKPGNFLGKSHKLETKEKISKSMNGNQNAQHRGDRKSYYKDIRMDSSWEVKTACYLDNNSINWKYNVQGFRLSDGRFYYPDFFIYDLDGSTFVKLIEVKGYFREANRLKYEKFLKE